MPRPRKTGPVEKRVDTVSIAERLVSFRKRRGLTQAELAEKIGVSRDLLSNYEQGRTHLTDETIILLAAALRVSADELLGIKQDQKTDVYDVSLRFLKRLSIIETFPEAKKKRILRNLDDAIEANAPV